MAETDGVLEHSTSNGHTSLGKQNGNLETSNGYKPLNTVRKPSELQQKIEKHREFHKKAHQKNSLLIDQQPKRTTMLSRNRLAVPPSKTHELRPDEKPLVAIDSDSEDEFDISKLPSQINIDLSQQLLKDGYRLDELPDDEDLDLIPPKPYSDRCMCCQMHNSICTIQ
ncbi:protein FAM219A-like [Ptychodera flava]|uniref:protein FAM219A-like n=1 Tax=Ptychodera flava TaxID=63121 RepID=UPI00396A2FD1